MNKEYIDDKTRLVITGSDIFEKLELQRKRKTWYGHKWATVAYNYTSLLGMEYKTKEGMVEWLFWSEKNNSNSLIHSDKAKKILNLTNTKTK